MRKGYVLVGVLVISLLLSLGAITSMSVLRKETRTTENILGGEKALEVARSGVEVAITKYKKEKTCGWTLEGNESEGSYIVKTESFEKGCKITSIGTYKDSKRVVKVIVEKGGSNYKPFVAKGDLSIGRVIQMPHASKWKNADLSVDGDVRIRMVGTFDPWLKWFTGEKAIKAFQEKVGFNLSKGGDTPDFPILEKTPENIAVEDRNPGEVVPPRFCDVECKDNAEIVFQRNGMALLKNCDTRLVQLSDDMKICSSKNLTVVPDSGIGSSWEWSSDINLTFYAKERLIIKKGARHFIDNNVDFDSLNMSFLSGKSIEVEGDLKVGSINLSGDLNLVFKAGEDVNIPAIEVEGANINGNINIDAEAGKKVGLHKTKLVSARIGGETNLDLDAGEKVESREIEVNGVDTGSFNFNVNAKNEVTSGDVKLSAGSFRNGIKINLSSNRVETGEINIRRLATTDTEISVAGRESVKSRKVGIYDSSIRGNVDINFQGNRLNVGERFTGGIELSRAYISKNFNLNVQGEENSEVGNIRLESCMVNGNSNVDLEAKRLQAEIIDIGGMSTNKLNINLVGDEYVDLEGGIQSEFSASTIEDTNILLYSKGTIRGNLLDLTGDLGKNINVAVLGKRLELTDILYYVAPSSGKLNLLAYGDEKIEMFPLEFIRKH
jgi:hypothetical protein